MTPQEFAEECVRILRYRIVDTRTDLDGDGQRCQLTEAWCMERARQIATVFATAGGPEAPKPVMPPTPPAICTHPGFDEHGMCHTCGTQVASAFPVEFARRVSEIYRGT